MRGHLQINHPRVASDPCPSSSEEGSFWRPAAADGVRTGSRSDWVPDSGFNDGCFMHFNSPLAAGNGVLLGFLGLEMYWFDAEVLKKTFLN
jgi:hypothetical protein